MATHAYGASAVYNEGMTDRLGNNAAAAHLGIKPSTWRDYVADGRAPKPDGIDEGFGKPYWLKSSLDKWNDARPGQGRKRPPAPE